MAVMMLIAVMTCERHACASGCDGFRRRQWIGIRAACNRKYLVNLSVQSSTSRSIVHLQYIPRSKARMCGGGPETEKASNTLLGRLQTALRGFIFGISELDSAR